MNPHTSNQNNSNGLRNDVKRRAIFNYSRSRADVICLQETHSSTEDELKWQLEWGNKIYYSHGENNARGVCVLIKRGLDAKSKVLHCSDNGRYLVLELQYNHITLLVTNIYGPNNDSPQFFGKIFNLTSEENENRIIIGDFNTVLDKLNDRKGELCNNEKSKETILDAMEKHMYTEIWRDRNPGVKQFSYYRKRPHMAASRLDYALVTRGLDRQIMSCFYIPSIFSDHKGFYISIGFKEIKSGSGFWMFNDTLLQNTDYVDGLNKLLEDLELRYRDVESLQKWELYKFECATYSQEFSRLIANEKKLIISQLYENLDILGERMDKELNEDNIDLYQKTKMDLEELEREQALSIMFRCKARWAMEAERNTKYFYSLEKLRHNARTCAVLIDDRGALVKGTDNILKLQREFYRKLYASDPSIVFQTSASGKQISEHQRQYMDHPIESVELETALKQMATGKTPGNDGLSVNFYKHFWTKLKSVYLNAIKAGLHRKNLHDSARRGVINLIPKQKRDSRKLKNLRPITLQNVDFKILEKALANRLKECIDDIIDPVQTGFIAGRSISINIRKAFEVVQNTEEDALAIFIDFQKAFDKIEFSAIYGAMQFFGIGPEYVDMVRTCYSDCTAVVQNNGLFSKPFQINRGLRQGAPNSSFLFLLCAQLLCISLQQNQQLKGIPINEIVQLMSQFADDMDCYTKGNEQCLEALFEELESFRCCTGLTVNYEKTSVYRMGSLRDSNAKYYVQKALYWTNDPVNVLGVQVCYDNDLALQVNYQPLIEKTRAILENWTRRKLSLLGRISIVNTLIASQFVYKMTVLPNIPVRLQRSLDEIIIKFIWNNSKPKIALSILTSAKRNGGAELVNFQKKQQSLKITWIKILQSNEQFKSMVLRHFKVNFGDDLWRCNLSKQHVECCIDSKHLFWSQVMEAWCDYNYQN